MKKRWIGILMAAVMVMGTMAGCGGDSGTTTAAGSETTAAQSGETAGEETAMRLPETWEILKPSSLA